MANGERVYLIHEPNPRSLPLTPYCTGTLPGGEQALLLPNDPYTCTYILRFRADGVFQGVQERGGINWYDDYSVIARWLEGIGFIPGPIRIREFSIQDPFHAYLSGGYPRYYEELGSHGFPPDEISRKHREWDEKGHCILMLGMGSEEVILEGAGSAE